MTDLIRFFLLAVAILFLLYVFWQQRLSRKRHGGGGKVKEDDTGPVQATQGELSSPRSVVSGMKATQANPVITDEYVEAAQQAYRSSKMGKEVTHEPPLAFGANIQTFRDDLKDEDLITLRLRARSDKQLYGNDILALLERHQIDPGSRSLFYKYWMDRDRNYKYIQFSVCNGTGDGSLRVQLLPTLETSQLLFFMDYTRAPTPVRFFDEMVRTAYAFEDALGGRLYTHDLSPLTQQHVNRERDRLQQYARDTKTHKLRKDT